VAGLPDGTPVPQRARDHQLVLLTGGTTGVPKAIGQRRRWSAPLAGLALVGGARLETARPTLICPPLFHGYGLAATCLLYTSPSPRDRG